MQQRATVLSCAALCMAMGASALQAQNPLSADTKFWYTAIKGFVTRAAEKMPEANYSFKPAPTVRTFGQIVGHIADDQYSFCSAVKGESKETDIEKTVTSKADLVAQLKEAFSYCDAVYDGFTDAHAADKIKTFAGERTKLSMLNFNYAHTYEHYGNIVTYMRIKGLVPPSSEPGQK
jgi:uncharacterized damage-inducible protein DinB